MSRRRASASWRRMAASALAGMILLAASAGSQTESAFDKGPGRRAGYGHYESGADRASLVSRDPWTPFDLPAQPAVPALGLVFADGRPAQWDTLRVVGSRWYWPLDRACAALGAGLTWDPLRLSGEILLDTLVCRFAVGGEVVHCAERAVQLSAPILYLDNRLLLPVDFASRCVAELLPERFVFRSDRLVQKPAGPEMLTLQIQRAGEQTYLRWKLPRQPVARLWGDGAGGLAVDLDGVHVDPLNPPRPAGRGDARLTEILPRGDGTQFVFALDPAIVGWRTEWWADQREFRIVLSGAHDEFGRGDGSAMWSAGPTGGEARPSEDVLIVVPGSDYALSSRSESSDAQALEYVRVLGERIVAGLRILGRHGEILEDTGPEAEEPWTAEANARGGAACICLRPDFVGPTVSAGFRVVSAPQRAAGRPWTRLDVDGESAAAMTSGSLMPGAGAAFWPVTLRPWDAPSAIHGRASSELAEVISLHLQAAAGGVPIRRQEWGTLPLRGLDMPGVLFYVGGLGDRASFPQDQDWMSSDQIGEAVAFALEAFLIWAEEMPEGIPE